LNRAAALSLSLCLLVAGCDSTPLKSDWEREHEARLPPPEEAVALPSYPKGDQLIEFLVAATSEFRFFIDAASISVGADGVVRYVLIARSPTGVDNVSFEGMRCKSAEVRIYALGRDGAWAGNPGEWRTIEPRTVQRWHNALYGEYFCPRKEPISSAREGVEALRRGGRS
jgi:hypothetical protein